jgi:hypothetical protein
MIRTYSELIQFGTLYDRFRYLELHGVVGEDTFGFDRWMNQVFYSSREWKQVRHRVIVRDEGCDLALPGHEIFDRVYIHHMNPITPEQLIHADESILDPEFLISCSHQTHNAIHYGDERQLPRPFTPRRPGDTKLW